MKNRSCGIILRKPAMITESNIEAVLRATIFGMCLAAGLWLANPAIAGNVVTDFSSFSEHVVLGNVGQDFTASGANVVMSHASGTGAYGQEVYLSDDFATLAAGERISVDWDGAETFDSYDQFGLAIGRTEFPTGRFDLVTSVWYPKDTVLQLRTFDSAGATAFLDAYNYGGTPPATLFIERTATGWSFGSINGGTETVHAENLSSVGAVAITADGSAFGLYSDMRRQSDNSYVTRTLRNLTVPLPPVVPSGATVIVR